MESWFSKTIRKKKIEAFFYPVQGFEVFYLFLQNLLGACFVPGLRPGDGNEDRVDDSVSSAWANGHVITIV